MEGLGESLSSPFCLLDLFRDFVTINVLLRVFRVGHLLEIMDSLGTCNFILYNFSYERVVNNRMLDEKNKLEIERNFMEIAELFKDSSTVIKTDHIAKSKYQELLKFITQIFAESDLECMNFVLSVIEEKLSTVLEYLEGFVIGYFDFERIKLALAVNCCYDLLLRKVTQEQAALDQQKKITNFSSSEIGILKILSKYTVLRYTELESYLKASEYWRSSSTYQREIKGLLDAGIIAKETLGKKPAYRLTSIGKLFINSNKDSRLENVSSYKLNPLYLNDNFLSKFDFHPCEHSCSAYLLIKEIASEYSDWDYLLEAWLFATEGESIPKEQFTKLMYVSLGEALEKLRTNKKHDCCLKDIYNFIRKKSLDTAELYSESVKACVGHYLTITFVNKSDCDNLHAFIMKVFDYCILNDRTELFVNFISKYGAVNSNELLCIVDYCRNLILSVVFRKLPAMIVCTELVNKLLLPDSIAKDLTEQIINNKEQIFKKIKY